MLSKIQKPKSKQELIKALQSAPIKSVAVYEGKSLSDVPSVSEMIRQKVSVILVK
ncbi:hypothetical protein [Sphingorhabdus sp.]|jgi:hypothetical protein|uniref:hypothetical protein n=1 Tax=Sphingorhabdus sp. TaxID=1902408 RepID=UPI0040544899